MDKWAVANDRVHVFGVSKNNLACNGEEEWAYVDMVN